ncbi:MAG: hypothetical protein HN894_08410 [Bacteroidetes bacterium]|nr:hypothetical protein [Bacteroidota bacterium]
MLSTRTHINIKIIRPTSDKFCFTITNINSPTISKVKIGIDYGENLVRILT